MIPRVVRTNYAIMVVRLVTGMTSIVFIAMLSGSDANVHRNEQAARRYMTDLEPEILGHMTSEAEDAWTYIIDNNEETWKRRKEGDTRNAQFFKNLANELQKYDYKSFKDADLKRRIYKLTKIGYQSLSEDKLNQLIDVIERMAKNFDNVNVCQFQNETNCNIKVVMTLNSEWKMMAKSRDPEELKHYWVQWHDAAGKPVRKDFEKYVTLGQEAAQLNNITYSADYWLRKYDDSSFEAQIDAAIEQIRPLYEQLHAYVRYKLRKVYGSDIVSEKGPIPIHLLGNLWGRKWDNIVDITVPYPSTPLIDITEELVGQGYTAVKMFEIADEFVQSLNMSKLPPTFWEKSILQDRKDGRDRACHPWIWDFYRKDDVRIKRCTHVTMKDFLRLQHELGYTQYYQQYQNQPSVYRDQAMPGFYEAIGHVFSLSVSTPKHLQKIGLLKESVSNEESKINQLFHSALRKVVYLPNIYLLAKYYLEIFRGHIQPENYNCKFWEMSSKHAGVEPPVMRSESDFDSVIRYALFVDLPRLESLLSYILQFQLYKAACEKAGEYVKDDPTKPLNNCDIYQSPAAGNALKKIMAMGSSKPWPDVLQTLTGQRKISADALLEYFHPLHDWLVKENKALGNNVGWEERQKCVRIIEDRSYRKH